MHSAPTAGAIRQARGTLAQALNDAGKGAGIVAGFAQHEAAQPLDRPDAAGIARMHTAAVQNRPIKIGRAHV